ncbi:fibrous sheath-interacting protein 1 isoform X2 [Sinocyclocheilus anshuiensis]|uniref:fibrous sheath-interacting protein 1 isoform X2 n=1 Tax=Sinocyclocheilus anshuiensis TaxID=1608454 RepID=UPI0007B7D769|nr:PREDICTED: fibrous sheath-interacting protein 1 isoform X2 [Sinocyclocheilus anshuiensis]
MEVSAGDVCRSVELITARADPEASLEESCGAEKLLTDQVSVDRMDITKGFLEDISRPASSEIRRPSRDGGRSLEVLSADATHSEVHRFSAHERTDLTAENSSDQEESDEENEDPELREAIKKMKRLDRVLALKASAEREVKQRGKQQHQRLWQELQTASLSMSSNEMENTRRFLALTPNNHQDGDEVDFVPVFETEVLDLKSDVNTRHEMDGHAEAGQQLMEDQPSDSRQRGAARSKRRQDFVKRNIELTEASGNSFLLTQQEKERIEELLKDLEEEENSSDLLTEPQVVSSTLSVCEGFGPEPSELHSLRHIDSRLQLLLPVQYFLSVRSPSQGSLQENTGDGERQRRDEERRLREIQQQLQLLEENEPRGSVRLSDDELRNLLQECEEDMIRSPAGSSSESSLGTSSALDASPRLSGSDLLQHSETDTKKEA